MRDGLLWADMQCQCSFPSVADSRRVDRLKHTVKASKQLHMRCKGAYTHKLEGGNRVPGATAVWLIRCGICRGDGGCALSIQVEDMHGALVTGDSQIVGWVPSRESNAEDPGWVCSPSKLLKGSKRNEHTTEGPCTASQPGVLVMMMSARAKESRLFTTCHGVSFGYMQKRIGAGSQAV